MVTKRTCRRGFPSHVYKKVNPAEFDSTKPYVVFRHETFGLIAVNFTDHYHKLWLKSATPTFNAKLETLRRWFGVPIRIDANEPLSLRAERADCYVEGMLLIRANLGKAKVRIPTRR